MQPKLRFNGFTDEWKQVKFNEMITITGTSQSDNSIPSVEYEDINSKRGTLNKNIFKKEVHKIGKRFNNGDILFGKLRPYLQNNLLADFNGIAVGDFWIFRSNIASNSYVFPFITTDIFQNICNMSIGSKMPRADWNLVGGTKFYMPLDKPEQEAIGEFFTQLDEQVNSSEAEIARLKQLKKGALQAMFPQPGENIPKIRFNGFSKPWKQVLVEELGEWAKGQTLSKDMISNIGKHKCLHYGKLFSEDEIIHQIETYTDINPIVTSQGNEILIPDSDVTPTGLGRCTHIPFKGVILGSGINIMRVKDNYDPHFCALNLTFNKEKIIKEVKGTTVMHVHAYNLSKIKLLIPSSLEEQAKIGEFFKQLDDQISLQEKKLLKLKQLKQAALNQMFV